MKNLLSAADALSSYFRVPNHQRERRNKNLGLPAYSLNHTDSTFQWTARYARRPRHFSRQVAALRHHRGRGSLKIDCDGTELHDSSWTIRYPDHKNSAVVPNFTLKYTLPSRVCPTFNCKPSMPPVELNSLVPPGFVGWSRTHACSA
jgi:hypothetical protein